MKINKILDRNRRDFTAIYECEHCGHIYEGDGYDDTYFHQEVIPEMECPECGKKAGKDYCPFVPKYDDNKII